MSRPATPLNHDAGREGLGRRVLLEIQRLIPVPRDVLQTLIGLPSGEGVLTEATRMQRDRSDRGAGRELPLASEANVGEEAVELWGIGVPHPSGG